MKMRPVLIILAVLSLSEGLLSQFEGSGAAGSETVITQELEMVGQAGGEMTAVAHTTATTDGSWIRTYPLEDKQFLEGLLLTTDGGALLLENGLIIKVDQYGEVMWQNSYPIPDKAYGSLIRMVEVTDGFVLVDSSFVYGNPSHDAWFLIKMDEIGQVVWAREYVHPEFHYQGVNQFIQTDDLGYLIAGYTADCTPWGCVGEAAWVAKLDVNGAIEWIQSYADPGVYGAYSVLPMDDDSFLVLLGGRRLIKLGANGSLIWSKKYDVDSGLPAVVAAIEFSSVQTAIDGGFILAGNYSFGEGLVGPFHNFCFLTKLDADGGVKWTRGYGAEAYDQYSLEMSVQETADGGYIATCSSRADYQVVPADFGLLKLDEDGHILWQKEIGGEGGNYPHTVVEQAENAFLIGGTTGFGGGQFDMTLWQVDLDDTLCRCPFYEGSFSTIDSMITTGAEVSVILESFTLNQSPLVITAQPETAVSNLICSTMVEEEITAVIPVSGGTVAASDGHISLVFPSGSFSETVQVTYRHFWDDVATGELAGMGERVGVTAVYSATQQPAQLLPGATVTATIHYTDNSPAIEETLAWYQWQETGWQRADSSQLSLPDETLTAVVEELGQFAVLGETYRVYMPGIPQNSNRQGYRLLLHLDESGNNFADRSGYGHDGQCDGSRCPTVVAGVNQMARHFDGVNDVIQLGYPQTLNLKGEVTLAAWLKPETAVGLQNIIAHGYALNPKAELFLRLNNGNYEVGSWDGSDHLASFAIPPTDIGQWVCLVGVYDGTAWRLYRNGVQVSSTAADTGAVSVHGRWAVGANGEGNGRFFQGSIDEVMVYDHGLTAVELAELYESYLSQ